MNEFLGIMQIIAFDENIPDYVKDDVSKRINDWCKAGGSETDDYVKRQYYYLLEVGESLQ